MRLSDEFFRTGTTHLLAISGQHVVILVYGLGFLTRFGWLPRRTSLLCTMAFVVVYALMTTRGRRWCVRRCSWWG